MSGPGILLGFGAVTAVLVWMDAGPASGFRHLYLVPTLWAALRFGGLGGGSGGLLAAGQRALEGQEQLNPGRPGPRPARQGPRHAAHEEE